MSKERTLCLWCLRTKSTVAEPDDVQNKITDNRNEPSGTAPSLNISIEYDDDDTSSLPPNEADSENTISEPDSNATIETDDRADHDSSKIESTKQPLSDSIGSTDTTANATLETSSSHQSTPDPRATKLTLRSDNIQPDGSTLGSILINKRSLRPIEHKGSDAVDYELLKQLGQGGMGVVYQARQTSLNRHVAIKRVRGEASKSERSRAKFIREAAITSELAHPNIIPIHDLGVAEDGGLYYAMKEVHGECWMDVLAKKTRDENLEILLDVCDAIAFAHSKNFIHRDLKPENVMLGDFGEVLVMDWGMAVDTETEPSPGGTPAYMSPEMACHYLATVGVAKYKNRFSKLGFYSDIYLLGAILFEIITGEQPHFGSESSNAKKAIAECLRHAADNAIDWKQLDDNELLQITRKALETNPSDRYATVQDFSSAIRAHQSHLVSIRLTDRAEVELHQALARRDYQIHSRAVFAYQDAIELWDENERAKRGLKTATLAYVESAEQKHDFELGMSMLDVSRQDEKEIYDRLERGARERERKVRLFRYARNAVVVLSGVVLVGAIAGWLITDNLWRIANVAKAKAEESETEARKLASLEAAAKEEEEIARRLAVDAKERAENAEKMAVEELATSTRAHFVSRIALAASQINDNQPMRALDLLHAIRNDAGDQKTVKLEWEWERLNHLCHPEVRDLATGGIGTKLAFQDGKTISASANNDQIIVRSWDVATQEVLLELESIAAKEVHGIALTRNGSHVILGCKALKATDPSLFVIDAHTGRLVSAHSAHLGNVLAVSVFDNDHRLVTGGNGPSVASGSDDTSRLKIWNLNEGRLEQTKAFHGHLGTAVTQVSVSMDESKLASLEVSDSESRIFVHSIDIPVVSSVDKNRDTNSNRIRMLKLPQRVDCLAFSNTSTKLLACGTAQNTILLLNIDDFPFIGDESPATSNARTLTGHNTPITSLSFSDDDRILISGGLGGEICVWRNSTDASQTDSHDYKLAQKLHGHRDVIESIGARNDIVASTSRDGVLRFWDLNSIHDQLELDLPRVRSAAISRTGKRLVTTTGGRAIVSSSVDGKTIAELEMGHDARVERALLRRDRLFTSTGDSICVWDATTGKQIQRFQSRSAFTVSPSGDDLIVAADGTSPTTIWDVNSGKLKQQIDDDGKRISAVCMSPDSNQLICGMPNGRLFAMAIDRQQILWASNSDDHSDGVSRIEWHSGSRQIVTLSTAGREIRVWAPSGKLIKRIPLQGSPTELICGDEFLAVLLDNAKSFSESIRVYSLETFDERLPDLQNLAEHRAVSAGFADKHSLFICTNSSEMVRVELRDNSIQHETLPTSLRAKRQLTVLGDQWLSISGGETQLLDRQNYEPTVQFDGEMVRADFSFDENHVVTLSTDGIIRLWAVSENQPPSMVNQLRPNDGNYIDFAVNSDGASIAAVTTSTGEVSKVCVIDLNNMAINSLGEISDRAVDIDWNNNYISVASSNQVHVWNSKTNEPCLPLPYSNELAAITCVRISPTGEFLVVGDTMGNARGYRIPPPATKWATDDDHVSEMQSADRLPKPLTSLCFTPSGDRLLTADNTGSVVLWYFSTDFTRELLVIPGHRDRVHSLDFSIGGDTDDGDSVLLTSGRRKTILHFAQEHADQ